MAEPLRYEPSRAAFKKRRREVEACLGELSAKKLRFPRPVEEEAAASPGRALADALRRLGPTFTALGSHLASRMDLLGEETRRELTALGDQGPPTPLPRVRQLVARELGPAGEKAFAHLEPRPWESRLFYQTHRARLASGEIVDVKLVHPELEEHFAYDLELLPLLEGVLAHLARRHGSRLDVAGCLAELRRSLASEIELLDEADALTALARDAQDGALLAAPRVYAELATSRLLVREALPGHGVERLAADMEPGGERDELVRDLAQAWLRQALSGGVLPVDPRPGHIAAAPDGSIACLGGIAAYPTPSFQRHLRTYLDATVAQDPDEALSVLLHEMAEAPADAEDEIRRRFRQLLPFRDGPQDFRGNHLADYLLLHWRLTTARGYRPRPLLLAFYQGLYRVRETLVRLAPQRDVLRDAFRELRLDGELGRWREAMDPKSFSVELRQYALLLAGMPRKMDEALERAAEGNVRLKLRLSGQGRPAASSAPMIALALLPALVAVTLVARYLASVPAWAGWSEKLGALVLALLGGWLLGTIRRCG